VLASNNALKSPERTRCAIPSSLLCSASLSEADCEKSGLPQEAQGDESERGQKSGLSWSLDAGNIMRQYSDLSSPQWKLQARGTRVTGQEIGETRQKLGVTKNSESGDKCC